MFFIPLLLISMVELSQIIVALLTITAALIAVSRWVIRKYTKNLNERTIIHPTIVELKANQKALAESAERHTDKLDELVVGIDKFKEDLDVHMENEEEIRAEEYAVIKQIQKDLDAGVKANVRDHSQIFEHLNLMEEESVAQALNIVKSMAISSDTPTLLYKTTPGDYNLIWHNIAWTTWTGLEIDDTRSGGDILAVHEDDRVTVEPNVAETGQLKEEVDVYYMMVRPKTGEKVGKVWAHGYPIHTLNDNAWYYVSRVKMLEPEPGWEHLL